jgi:hypothetical protein
MQNLSLLKNCQSFFIICVILLASCNDGTADKNTSAAATDSIKAAATAAPVAAIIGGVLDTLFVDSLTFTKLDNGKVVFSFTYRQNDTLTLHGWDAKGICGDGFNNSPDIRLIKARPATVSYGPDIYFSNVVLQGKDVKDIKSLLKVHKAQYVVFAPQKLGEHIGYKIFLSKEYPAILVKILTVIPTDTEANPSPPKNS